MFKCFKRYQNALIWALILECRDIMEKFDHFYAYALILAVTSGPYY